MITPLSQFVGVQASMNVIAGEPYKEVSDNVIHYALGRYGEEAVTAMNQDVRAKILDRSQAKKAMAERPPDPTIEELRQMYGGSSISDEELMFRVQVDGEIRKKLVTPSEHQLADSPVSLVQELVKAGRGRSVHLSRPGMTLTLGRTSSEGE